MGKKSQVLRYSSIDVVIHVKSMFKSDPPGIYFECTPLLPRFRIRLQTRYVQRENDLYKSRKPKHLLAYLVFSSIQICQFYSVSLDLGGGALVHDTLVSSIRLRLSRKIQPYTQNATRIETYHVVPSRSFKAFYNWI